MLLRILISILLAVICVSAAGAAQPTPTRKKTAQGQQSSSPKRKPTNVTVAPVAGAGTVTGGGPGGKIDVQDTHFTMQTNRSSPSLGPKAGGKKTIQPAIHPSSSSVVQQKVESSSGQTIKIGSSKTESAGGDSIKIGTTRAEKVGDQTATVGASKRQVRTTAITPPADAVQGPARPTQQKHATTPHQP